MNLIMIKKFNQFLNENISGVTTPVLNPEEIVRFHLSSKFSEVLKELKSFKVAELYSNLKNGIRRKKLVNDPVNYLDFDKEGNVSFLKSRFFNEEDKWNNTRRQKMKITKVLKDIYNENYLNTNLKQTDVESFLNRLSAYLKPAEVVEFRGKDVMRAFNINRELDLRKFGMSCANFGQKDLGGSGYPEPSVSWFDIYTKNPENIGVVVVMDHGNIVGRRTFQQGIQVNDSRDYKKGEYYTIYGNFYGEFGRRGKYDQMILDYLKEKYNAKEMNSDFMIKLKETRFEQYCPFDSMYVNFKTNMLSGKFHSGFTSTYKARCPASLVLEREKEEEEQKQKLNSEIN